MSSTSVNPDISKQIYSECVNSWRNLQIGLFYAKIPRLLKPEHILHLVDKFEFPVMSDQYALDKGFLKTKFRDIEPEVNGFNSFSFSILFTNLGNIFRATKEGIDKEVTYSDFLSQKLGSQYIEVKELVYFLRNFYSHNIDDKLRIHPDDIRSIKYESLKINISISSKTLSLNGPDIEFLADLDFANISAGDPLVDSIGFDYLFLFADLCNRLALDFSQHMMNEFLKSKRMNH